jgi:hypothetical protein
VIVDAAEDRFVSEKPSDQKPEQARRERRSQMADSGQKIGQHVS